MDSNTLDYDDVMSGPELSLSASVTFDKRKKAFEYNKDFFTKIALAEG